MDCSYPSHSCFIFIFQLGINILMIQKKIDKTLVSPIKITKKTSIKVKSALKAEILWLRIKNKFFKGYVYINPNEFKNHNSSDIVNEAHELSFGIEEGNTNGENLNIFDLSLDSKNEQENLDKDGEKVLILKKIIQKEVGITNINTSLLSSALDQIAKSNGYKNISDLITALIENSINDIHQKLFDLVTMNDSCFYRDKEIFDEFINDELPFHIASNKEKVINVWSAACAGGYEPYTIAMILSEELLRGDSDWSINIYASDLSKSAIKFAYTGVYDENQVSNLPKNYIKNYFIKKGDKFYIRENIKKLIKFEERNLVNNPEPLRHKFDYIFLRNVLYYFDAIQAKSVLKVISKNLNEGGGIILGLDENLTNTKFLCRQHDRLIIYNKIY